MYRAFDTRPSAGVPASPHGPRDPRQPGGVGPTGEASRRHFLQRAGAAVAGATLSASWPGTLAARPNTSVGIVGAGLAGLSCADALARKGFRPVVYEAAGRVGGRCFSGSLPGFAGQVMERGGELVDNLHKTMLGYAKRFGLTRELQWRTWGGDETLYFHGRHYTAAEVVDEFRDFVPAMRDDLRLSSGTTTAESFTPYDEMLDRLSLDEYFDLRGASPLVRAAFGEAYRAEYGLDLHEQSALNFLYFAKADRRSRFMPFGPSSDERYHILEGNDRIPRGLAADLASAGLPVRHGLRLARVGRRSDGRVELAFDGGPLAVHDVVVLAVPFTALRLVDLDASLDLPPSKVNAIHALGYGTNAKTMIGFNGRPWAAYDSVGVSYSDLPDHQATWETNPAGSSETQAILTDYASGQRGASLSPAALQAQVDRFLDDLDLVWPGARAAARRHTNGDVVAHLEHWPSNPFALGSYTCYRPGQFTTIAGYEGTPVGNLYFAGEHANSFYEWQGFMEGACLSGLQTADAIWRAYR
jgi:monoamine oxidase